MIDAPAHHEVENGKKRKILRDPLFDAALRFNLFPAEYAHPSWPEMLGNVLPHVFTETDKTHAFESRCISRALLSLCGAESEFDFDFSDHGKRIVLLPHDTLMSLGMYVLAVLAQAQLREVIMRAEIHAINKAIGEEIRIFGLCWQGDEAPAFGKLGKEIATYVFDADRSQRCAVRLIRALIQESEAAVRRRVALKQPVRWRSVEPFDLYAEQRHALSSLFISVLQNKWPELFQQIWSDREYIHADNRAH